MKLEDINDCSELQDISTKQLEFLQVAINAELRYRDECKEMN